MMSNIDYLKECNMLENFLPAMGHGVERRKGTFLDMNTLIEPEVWIEYQRADMSKDSFARRSLADAIHRYDIMPDGLYVRTRQDGHDSVWEYLA
ncbi:hypothetical protein LCGC14_1586910 [marine sediment metagenome]|uniref:Uncharacterized protein n=1 Tax=marine sediment metagenome TaxID=412755 RepID=A0A0F9KVU1_9ZZZZ